MPGRALAIVVVGLLCASTVAAAEGGEPSAARNSLFLGYGLGTFGRQDQIFSQTVHGGFGALNILLGYEREGTIRHNAAVAYRSVSSSVLPPFEFRDELRDATWTAFPHRFDYVSLAYGAALPFSFESSLAFFPGLGVQSRIDALNYNYGSTGHFGYHAVFGLQPLLGVAYSFSNSDRLSLDLRTTIVGWTARSPYSVNDDLFIENISSHSSVKTFLAFIGDGELQSLGRLQELNAGIEYRRLLGSRWMGMVRVDTRLLHATLPRPVTAIDTVVSVGGGIRI